MNKTKIMKANTKSKNVVTVGGKPLEETDCFTYLGNKINKTGGTEEVRQSKQQHFVDQDYSTASRNINKTKENGVGLATR